MDKFDWTVAEFLKQGSQMWTEADITKVLRYVVVTAEDDREFASQIHHHFVNDPSIGPWTIAQVGYQRLACESKNFKSQKLDLSSNCVSIPLAARDYS